MKLPDVVESLIAELGKLPGVGRKTAERLAFHLLAAETESAERLSEAVLQVKRSIQSCPTCHFFTENQICSICSDTNREPTVLCVVEQPLDVIAIDKAGGFRGLYHVLGGSLSPLRGVATDDLHIGDLFRRIRSGEFTEVVVATNPNVEGDATAFYLARQLQNANVRVTRIGRGVPMGSSLEYADPTTLQAAFDGRKTL